MWFVLCYVLCEHFTCLARSVQSQQGHTAQQHDSPEFPVIAQGVSHPNRSIVLLKHPADRALLLIPLWCDGACAAGVPACNESLDQWQRVFALERPAREERKPHIDVFTFTKLLQRSGKKAASHPLTSGHSPTTPPPHAVDRSCSLAAYSVPTTVSALLPKHSLHSLRTCDMQYIQSKHCPSDRSLRITSTRCSRMPYMCLHSN